MTPLVIAHNDVRRVFREREALFWLFVGPVIFVAFFGVLFKPPQDRKPRITLINKDADDRLVRHLTAGLERDGIVVRTSASADARPALEIPAGAAAAIDDSRAPKVTFYGGDEESNAERSLQFKVVKGLILFSMMGAPAGQAAAPPFKPGGGEALPLREVIKIVPGDLGVKRQPMTAGFQRSVPSYLVMFVFLNLLVAGAGITEEKASGRLKRMFIAPIRKRDIILGKLLGRVAIGWIQVAYMLLVGVFVFRIQWAEHPWVFFAFISIFAVACASLGVAFGTFFNDPDKAEGIAVWTAILLSPLGGLWWPLEIVGPTMKKIGQMVPTGWAMEAVNSMLAFGAGAWDVAPYAGAFVAVAVVSLTIASLRLRPS
jgi:ABC-2 type transport system permease protein